MSATWNRMGSAGGGIRTASPAAVEQLNRAIAAGERLTGQRSAGFGHAEAEPSDVDAAADYFGRAMNGEAVGGECTRADIDAAKRRLRRDMGLPNPSEAEPSDVDAAADYFGRAMNGEAVGGECTRADIDAAKRRLRRDMGLPNPSEAEPSDVDALADHYLTLIN